MKIEVQCTNCLLTNGIVVHPTSKFSNKDYRKFKKQAKDMTKHMKKCYGTLLKSWEI